MKGFSLLGVSNPPFIGAGVSLMVHMVYTVDDLALVATCTISSASSWDAVCLLAPCNGSSRSLDHSDLEIHVVIHHVHHGTTGPDHMNVDRVFTGLHEHVREGIHSGRLLLRVGHYAPHTVAHHAPHHAAFSPMVSV